MTSGKASVKLGDATDGFIYLIRKESSVRQSSQPTLESKVKQTSQHIHINSQRNVTYDIVIK